PDPPERVAGRTFSLVFLVMVAMAFVIGLVFLFSSRAPAPGTDLADLLKKHPREYDLSLGHFLDLTPEAMGAFRVPLLGAVVSMFLGAGANYFLRTRGRPGQGNMALALMMVGLLASV